MATQMYITYEKSVKNSLFLTYFDNLKGFFTLNPHQIIQYVCWHVWQHIYGTYKTNLVLFFYNGKIT